MEKERIIERQRLENGMELVLYDRSRIMVGDRWVVDLHCEAFIPINDSYWDAVAAEDPQHLAAIKGMLGGELVFSSHKKRNFVAAAEREKVFQEMVQQVYDGMLEYLKKPNFPQRLFKKKYDEVRRKILIRQAMNQTE